MTPQPDRDPTESSQELALLKLLRAWPGPPKGKEWGLNWEGLSESTKAHGLGAWTRRAILDLQLEPPAEVQGSLERQALGISMLGRRLKALLLKTLDSFSAEGITPVLLKGYGLAARLYPDPFLRMCTDIDLLANPDELQRTIDVLTGMGFRRVSPEREMYALRALQHIEFTSPEGMVELHWRPFSGFGASMGVEGPWSRSVAGQIEGRHVRFLGAEDELIFLAVHAAQHLFERLGWLLDLKLYLKAFPELDWEAVLDHGASFGLESPTYFGLNAAARLVAAPVPEFVLSALKPPAWQRSLEAKYFSDRRLTKQPSIHRYHKYLLRLLMATGFRNRVREAVSVVQTSFQNRLNE